MWRVGMVLVMFKLGWAREMLGPPWRRDIQNRRSVTGAPLLSVPLPLLTINDARYLTDCRRSLAFGLNNGRFQNRTLDPQAAAYYRTRAIIGD